MSSGPRKFFGNRNQIRPQYDRVNIKYVPPSRHAIFIRGLPSDLDISKIKDFFQDASQSNVGVDFTSSNEEQRRLCVALRFESHDIAKDIFMKFNQTEVFGHRIEISWFKDLKKARDRMLDEKRSYDERMKSKFEYERHDNRDYSGGGGAGRRRMPYNSQSRDHEERSEASGQPRRKPSSDIDRSRSQSSNRSDRSNSVSEADSDVKNNFPGAKQPVTNDKPAAYKVDLDEEDGVVHSAKETKEEETLIVKQITVKHESDDKKKKKKKRKRRRLDHSESIDSSAGPAKIPKTSLTLDTETGNFSAIAGDMSNWKQTASDSDDFLTKNNQISHTKTFVSLVGTDKLNSDKSLKLMKMKVENIEKAYKRDSETYSSVVSVLIRKSPDLKNRLEAVLKEVLLDLGNQCTDSLREYVLHLSENNPASLDVSVSPASSI